MMMLTLEHDIEHVEFAPEIRLMLAVLERAVVDYITSPWRCDAIEKASARAFFELPDNSILFSLENICSVLGFSSEAFLERLSREPGEIMAQLAKLSVGRRIGRDENGRLKPRVNNWRVKRGRVAA